MLTLKWFILLSSESMSSISSISTSISVWWDILVNGKQLKVMNEIGLYNNSNLREDQITFVIHHTTTFQQPSAYESNSSDGTHTWRWETFHGALSLLHPFRWNLRANLSDLAIFRNHWVIVSHTAFLFRVFYLAKLWSMCKMFLICIYFNIRCSVSLLKNKNLQQK